MLACIYLAWFTVMRIPAYWCENNESTEKIWNVTVQEQKNA